MTTLQMIVLRKIHRASVDRGYGPTFRELCDWMGWSSPNAANRMITVLRKQGMLDKGIVGTPKAARTIRLTPHGERTMALEDFRSIIRFGLFRLIHPETIDAAALPVLEDA